MNPVDIVSNELERKVIRLIALDDKNNYKVHLSDGSELFLKTCIEDEENFINQAFELSYISRFVKTPKIHFANKNAIALEWINKSNNFKIQKQLGEKLADLHSKKKSKFGFYFDNKIGDTYQKNSPLIDSNNWAIFFWNYRLEFQINLAQKNNYIDVNDYQKLMNLKEVVLKRLDIRIKPSLLHGDLWSGNFLTTKQGPYFIDTASYYGHSEADFALTYMFGGFSKEFYQSYEKRSPFEENHEERKPIYMIYHYLNHLNLFGRSYLGGVLNCYQQIIN